MVGIGIIVALSAVNYVGVKQGSRVQTAFTAVKLAAVALIVVVGVALGSRVPEHFVGRERGDRGIGGGFLRAMVAGLFAYGGWHMVTYSAEETVEPAKTIPRALVDRDAGRNGRVHGDERRLPVRDAARQGGGVDARGRRPRRYAAGLRRRRDRIGDRAHFHVRRADGDHSGRPARLLRHGAGRIAVPVVRRGASDLPTPHRAIVVQAIWSSLLVATGTFRALFTRVVYTEWIFFGLMAIGLMVLRRRAGITRGYRIWGYPMTPLLFVIVSFAVVVNALLSNPKDSAIGLGVVLIGVPVYWAWGKR